MDVKNAKRALNIKLAFGIAIPMLVIVITLSMVGASFAWFSDAEDTYIQSITITTEQAYSVSLSKTDDDLNWNYSGQTALDRSGRLVTSSSVSDVIDDRAFCFVKVLRIDTEGETVNFNLSLTEALIEVPDTRDGDNNPLTWTIKADYSSQRENIPYVFTWFMKAHEPSFYEGNKVTNYVDTDGDFDTDNDRKMRFYQPSNGEEWFTPYGKLTFGADSKVTKINGEDVSTTLYDIPEPTAITDFSTTGAKLFDLYIVFAPEKLFYMQFFNLQLADETVTAPYVYKKNYTYKDVYPTTYAKIDGGRSNQMFYSSYDYLEAKFSFEAAINVVLLHIA